MAQEISEVAVIKVTVPIGFPVGFGVSAAKQATQELREVVVIKVTKASG